MIQKFQSLTYEPVSELDACFLGLGLNSDINLGFRAHSIQNTKGYVPPWIYRQGRDLLLTFGVFFKARIQQEGNLPPTKAYSGLPYKSDSVCAPCGCKSSAGSKQI